MPESMRSNFGYTLGDGNSDEAAAGECPRTDARHTCGNGDGGEAATT